MTNWKSKLLAFLHDPPSKAPDTATDVESSTRLQTSSLPAES